MSEQLNFSFKPDFTKPTLIVSWMVGAGGLGEQVTDYLNRKLGGRCFCEIDPSGFFPLHGVSIENDVIQFPVPGFFACSRKNLVIFRSPQPAFEWYCFLNLVLEVARDYCQVADIYTIDSMVSLLAHTAPREILGNFSNDAMKNDFLGYDVRTGWDYETPPGQRPTLNSFLLWSAQRKNMRAASLWVPVPFYLEPASDCQGQLRMLEFLNRKLDLDIALDDVREKALSQDKKIMTLRESFPEIDRLIKKIESGTSLSPEESQHLTAEMGKHLSSNIF